MRIIVQVKFLLLTMLISFLVGKKYYQGILNINVIQSFLNQVGVTITHERQTCQNDSINNYKDIA